MGWGADDYNRRVYYGSWVNRMELDNYGSASDALKSCFIGRGDSNHGSYGECGDDGGG
jgi:hypothetical protein